MLDDREYMGMALDLAAKGAGRVSPNPMVGAVVVKDGLVVGQGFHEVLGGPHAEVHALDQAGAEARGAVLYVNLEPCNHQGRTPPCTWRILEAGIRRVVVAMADPNPDVAGGGNAYLQSQGLEVNCGVCREAAERLNECFVKFVRTKRPFVVLKLAATLDGRIATRTGDARWVSGDRARDYVHRLRHGLDAILVGVGTAKADDPRLTARLQDGQGVDPVRIVLDTRLRMSEDARMLNQASSSPTYIVCGPQAASADKERLVARGGHILEVPVKAGHIELEALLERLGGMGITSILVEGGARVAGMFLRAGAVDKVLFFYAPKILGGDDGVPMCRGPGPELMKACIGLDHLTVERMGEDIMVQGYPRAQT